MNIEGAKLNSKIAEVSICDGSRSTRVSMLRLNGSANILPKNLSETARIIEETFQMESGTQLSLSTDALIEAIVGGSEHSEKKLVRNLREPEELLDGSVTRAMQTSAFIGGRHCTIVLVDTRGLQQVPFSRLHIIYDYPDK